MEEKKSVFRKESLDKMNSPDDLNQYIRVSNPGVWMILIGILALLVGICVWGIFGHLDTVVKTSVVVKNGKTVAYVPDSQRDAIQAGMLVWIDGREGSIESVNPNPLRAAQLEDYARYLGEFQESDWVCELGISQMDGITDGIYSGKIVLERVKPMSFVFNE